MKRKLITTADGSHTFYIEKMDEQYHSKHGSIAESQHIFIEKGLMKVAEKKTAFKIFEVGFGTGLNAYLTAIAAVQNQLNIELHSIEAFPLKEEEACLLNYPKILNNDDNLFQRIHQSQWDVKQQINKNFQLTKIESDLAIYTYKTQYDLVYFDAFAPDKQTEMWRPQIFKNLYAAMKKDGILVTYCVKGSVRRMLQAIGFEIEKVEGPKNGKREMLRATKV